MMAHNETTTTEATLDDLRNEVPSMGFRISENNEGVNVYTVELETENKRRVR